MGTIRGMTSYNCCLSEEAPHLFTETAFQSNSNTRRSRGNLNSNLGLACRYGGQFAYVEIINSMKKPARFTSAVALSTPIMSVAYLSLGVIGYWSRGRGVQEIIIFGTGMDVWSRIAAGAILFQVFSLLLPVYFPPFWPHVKIWVAQAFGRMSSQKATLGLIWGRMSGRVADTDHV